MAVPIQNLRSGTATKRPVASGLAFGQVAVNYNEADPAIYLRGDANALIKVSPVFVGTGAPNATPASGGSAGNSKGEQWLDTASSPPTPKIWNGSAFVSNYTFTSGTTIIQPVVTSGTVNNSTISGSTIINTSLTDPAIIGTILEDVFTITDGAAFEIDPGNGSVQLITLGASRTPKATNMVAGEAVTLMVADGTAYTLTWTDATFGGTGVVWKTNAGVAPTLNTTGYTVIVLWKVSTQVYGARVGDA